MSKLKGSNDNAQSGFNNFDDCGVYQINDKQSIIQTVDFFTPIVDDPYTFGQIAAANALSDIYAMGGKPLFALNIVAFPTEDLSLDILSLILKGGEDKCKEADVSILGGHSIKDKTPKFGLAVTSLIDNDKILKNNTPKNKDIIILTKPLGTGILTTAIKKDLADVDTIKNVSQLMSSLNINLSSTNFNISACTDVTGYGLLGHLNEMSNNTSLSAVINFTKIPFIDSTEIFAKDDVIPGGTKNNLKFYKNNIKFHKSINEYQKLMLADAQTSGGLLISIPENNANNLLEFLNNNSNYESKIIGRFINKKDLNIIVNNE